MAGVRARSKSTAASIGDEDLTRLRMTLGRLGRVLRQQTDEDLSYAPPPLLFTAAAHGVFAVCGATQT